MVQFIMLYKGLVVLTVEDMRMKTLSVTVQTKAIEQYFPVVLFMIMLYKWF